MTSRQTQAPPSRIKRSQQVIERAEKRAEGAKVANSDPRERNVKEAGHQRNSMQNTPIHGGRYDS